MEVVDERSTLAGDLFATQPIPGIGKSQINQF